MTAGPLQPRAGMDTLPFRTADEVEQALPRVIDHLRADGVIAYPTETVYGFGCAVRPRALERLRALKRRTETKPFLLLVAEPADLPGLHWTQVAERLAAAFWPGPLTLALAASSDALPAAVRSADGTVAVRATPHAGVRRLLQRLGAPITSSSANVPGGEAALDARGAARALAALDGADVLLLDGGPLPPSPPSTVIDASCTPPRVLRAGAVGLDALRNVIGEIDAG